MFPVFSRFLHLSLLILKKWHEFLLIRPGFRRQLRRQLSEFLKIIDYRIQTEKIIGPTQNLLQFLRSSEPVANRTTKEAAGEDLRSTVEKIAEDVAEYATNYLRHHILPRNLWSDRVLHIIYDSEQEKFTLTVSTGDSVEEYFQGRVSHIYQSRSAQIIAQMIREIVYFEGSRWFFFPLFTPTRGIVPASRAFFTGVIWWSMGFGGMWILVHYGWLDPFRFDMLVVPQTWQDFCRYVLMSSFLTAVLVWAWSQVQALWARMGNHPWMSAGAVALLEGLFGQITILTTHRQEGVALGVLSGVWFMMIYFLLSREYAWSRWLRATPRTRFLAFLLGFSPLIVLRGMVMDGPPLFFLVSNMPFVMLAVYNALKPWIIERILAHEVYAIRQVQNLRDYESQRMPLERLQRVEKTLRDQEIRFCHIWVQEFVDDLNNLWRIFLLWIRYINYGEEPKRRWNHGGSEAASGDDGSGGIRRDPPDPEGPHGGP